MSFAAPVFDTPPPCGLWIDPASACCEDTPPPGLCYAPVNPTCDSPTPEQLARVASTILNHLFGGFYPGWCPQIDEVCHEDQQQCGCESICDGTTRCCKRDRLPVGSARWPIRNIVEVRYDDPDTGPIVPANEYRLVDGHYLENLRDGWPACRRIFTCYYAGGIPLGGADMARRLFCILQRLWNPTDTHACSIPLDAPLTALSWDGASAGEQATKTLFMVDPIVDQWVQAMTKSYTPRTPTGFVWWPSKWHRTHVRGGLN